MTRFVVSLGFSTEPVVRPIMSRGVSEGDLVELIHPRQESDDMAARTDNAVSDIENTFGTVGAEVTVERTAYSLDPYDGIETCVRVLTTDRGEDETVVVLGGGSSGTQLGLAAAATTRSEIVDDVVVQDEARGTFRPELPRATADPPGRTDPTLAGIVQTDGPLSISELADRTEQSNSTVSRHVDALASESIVTTRRSDGQRLVSLSLTGRVLPLDTRPDIDE